MKRKNINCNKFPKYASLLSLWCISARERSSVDPHSELIENYLATCTCFICDRYLPKRTNVREHIVSLISPVCKHLPWQPLGHQPPETWDQSNPQNHDDPLAAPHSPQSLSACLHIWQNRSNRGEIRNRASSSNLLCGGES